MSWEKKFNTIINDTKANLSRVKNKYEVSNSIKNVTFSPAHFSTPMKRSTSMSELPGVSSSMYPSSMLPMSANVDMYQAPPATSFMTYPSTQTLLDKIEQQNSAIDHLRSLVHRLETDRHNYKEQIRDLRNEIFEMGERAGDRRPDPNMERRVEQVRREMLGEIQLLQSQVQMTSAKGSNSHLSDVQLLSLNRDIMEIKHAYRDELEGLRKDVEIMRSRVAKIELELTGVLSGRRNVGLMDTGTQSPHIPSSNLAIMTTNRQLEKLQINELRSTMNALQGKMEMLEHHQRQRQQTKGSHSQPSKLSPTSKPIFSNGFTTMSKGKSDELLEDLDLSDGASSVSSDFTEFEQEPDGKYSGKRGGNPADDSLDEDELDVDDLELSDDDLSQTSLSDPMCNGDLT